MNPVKVKTEQGIMTATLADVENRNALGMALLAGLNEALDAAEADDGIRALVITNEGSTFCAGANLKERSGAAQAAAPPKNAIGFEEMLEKIQHASIPVIGRIAGHVVGGGNGLAASLDIAIAQEDVKFGFTEVRLGVIPAIISVVCLPKMRPGEAMEAFLRGNRFPASKAADYGLISRAVPADQLDTAVEEVLSDIRKGGPNALSLAKRLVYDVPAMETKEAFQYTSRLSGQLFAGEEAKEGMAAFLGKRKAAWAEEDQ
ncbi:MAG: enoyl-CoA hydratase-related protein [Myxococcota bacterium]|nr:enoyl-CoA hydratase-related protein [Myxococcota bacterium]